LSFSSNVFNLDFKNALKSGDIKMDLQEVGGACGDWMELAEDRDRWRALLKKVMNLRVPKCGEFFD